MLLPAACDDRPGASWPVLYLLHGMRDGHGAWMRETEVKELTADLDLLVVMPGAGEYGYYTDWRNGGEGGPPMWETFHLVELRQLLERNFGVDDRRLVAGLSMGGFGAMSRLDALHIPVTAVSGPGTHTWPYWQRALREALPILLEAIRS